MGQYHILACPEAGSIVNPQSLGVLQKALEQISSCTIPAALAILCSAGRGRGARDLPWAPVGPWAGKMPLMIGDYSENGDIIGRDALLGMPESELYDARSPRATRLDSRPARRKKLKDIAPALLPVLERAHDIRFNHVDHTGNPVLKEQWRTMFYPVCRNGDGWAINTFETAGAEKDGLLDFYERIGAFEETAWQRDAVLPHPERHFTPGCAVPDNLPDYAEAPGERMIWVNLDRREFIDPAAMGDTPDMVGIMAGHSTRAVLAMIVFHERRGGGDIDPTGPIHVAGRWRGDRIVLMGSGGFRPAGESRLYPKDVYADFLDITGTVDLYTRLEDIYQAQVSTETGRPKQLPGPEGREILSHMLRAPAARTAIDAGRAEDIRMTINPAMTFTPPGQDHASARMFQIAPSADLFIASGKVFLPGDIRKRIAPILDRLPVTRLDIRHETRENHHGAARMGSVMIDRSAMIEFTPRSRHDVLSVAHAD